MSYLGNGFLRAIEIRSMPSFRGEVKLSAPCHKSLQHWWTNQDFSPVDIIPPWFSTLIYHLGDEHLVAAAQRLSLIPST
jgi:hypothetical protein